MGALILARSFYSFGYGVESPLSLVQSAPSDASCLVLADAGGAYGMPDLADAALRAGVRAGAGARLPVGGRDVVFIAMSGGWPQLSSLVTAFRTSPDGSPPECLAGCGRLAALVFSPAQAGRLSSCGFDGEVYGAVLPAAFGRPPREAAEAFADAGAGPVACQPVVFTSPGSFEAHRMVRSASLRSAEASLSPGAFASRAAVMPAPGDLGRAFADVPAAVANAAELASGVEGFRPVQGLLGSVTAVEDARRLKEITEAGLTRLYGRSRTAARRLETELAAVLDAGLAGYFLAFMEVAEFCAAHGIAATARGSAAGSIISRLLGISGVCPVRYGLPFTRFFNTLRPDAPDIDLDIDSLERDRVVSWALDRWGARSACVGEVVCHRRRSAFRLAAVSTGLSPADVDTMSALLEDREADVWRRQPGRYLLERAALVEGLPSHMAPHPCGIVIAPGPVREVVPLEPGASGQLLTQFDHEGVESAGLLKMDLLGQRGLSAISLASRWSGLEGGLVLAPPRDPGPALELLGSGRTIGVTHVESPAMRGLLRGMRIESLEDVAEALAMVRPGASAGTGRRRPGATSAAVPRDGFRVLEEELHRSLPGGYRGLMFEDDVSECASSLLGIGAAEGDLVRRELRKGRLLPSDLEAWGSPPARAAAIHALLSGFKGYGFCRAHAFSYAAVACVSAAIKAVRPAEFMAAVLAGGGGFYDQRTYVEEARRMGLRILPPGVNSGAWAARPVDGGVMLGFGSLRGMGPAEFAALERGRPFSAPSEVSAAGVGRQVVKAMAMAGCFGEIGLNRSQSLWAMNAKPGGFFSREETGLPGLPDHGDRESVELDLHYLGAAVTRCPLSLVGRPHDTLPLADIPPSGRYSVWGRAASQRRLEAGAGFLMLEDDTGYADVFLPSPLFRMARLVLRREGSTLVARVSGGPDGRLRASSVCAGPLTPGGMVV